MFDERQARPRFWQFILKGLLILMLIVAGYCAGWATAMRRVRRAEERARVERDQGARSG